MEKYCGKCQKNKLFKDFGKCNYGKFGLNSHCKSCRKEYDLLRRDELLKYHKEKRENELEKFKIYDKKYKSENRDKQNEYNKKRWKEDEQYRLRKILRVRFYSVIQKDKKIKSVILLLGCTVQEFKLYIEILFKPEMSWVNFGDIWELDHIIPCSSFDLTLFKEQEKCFHHSNYQPLFKTTEIAKSFGYTDEVGNRNKYNKNL